MDASSPLKKEHLHFLKAGVNYLNEHEPEFQKLKSELPQATLESICDEDFYWSDLYEIPPSQFFLLVFSAFGLLPALIEAVQSGVNPNQAIIDQVNKMLVNPDEFISKLFNLQADPKSLDELKAVRVNGIFTLSELFCLTNAALSQVVALRKHGKTFSQLVDDVREGRDESFWLALHIDPTVLSCSVFARRMSLAYQQNDFDFFRAIGTKIKTKWKKPKFDLDSLRVILHACNEAKWLDNLPESEADKLFIQELAVYSNDGEDPARSLKRFIDRWKKTL